MMIDDDDDDDDVHDDDDNEASVYAVYVLWHRKNNHMILDDHDSKLWAGKGGQNR